MSQSAPAYRPADASRLFEAFDWRREPLLALFASITHARPRCRAAGWSSRCAYRADSGRGAAYCLCDDGRKDISRISAADALLMLLAAFHFGVFRRWLQRRGGRELSKFHRKSRPARRRRCLMMAD